MEPRKKKRKTISSFSPRTPDNASLSNRIDSNEPELPVPPPPLHRFIYSLNDSGSSRTTVAFLHPNQSLAFCGVANVRVLVGCLWIHGYCLKPERGWMAMHSPRTSSLLVLTADSEALPKSSVWPQLREDENESENEIARIVDELRIDSSVFGAVLLIEECQSSIFDFFKSLGTEKFSDVFQVRSQSDRDAEVNSWHSLTKFRLVQDPENDLLSVLSIPLTWEQAVQRLLMDALQAKLSSSHRAPIVLICGNRNSGKSTYSRYAVNIFLNKFSEVAFLDTDVGQSEFTAPGFVSLNVVKDPIFGPAFCHQQEPVISHFFGDVTPKRRPGFYLDCVESCIRYFETTTTTKHSFVPLIVNCHGWVRGLGELLFNDLLRIVKPTHLVHLNPPDTPSSKALPSIDAALKPDALTWRPKLAIVQQPLVLVIAAHPHQSISSGGRDRAGDARQLSLLAHLSRMFDARRLSLLANASAAPWLASPLSLCTPYRTSWNRVIVQVMHAKVASEEILWALNASIVGLGVIENKEAEIDDCVSVSGFPRLIEKTSSPPKCLGLGLLQASFEQSIRTRAPFTSALISRKSKWVQ
ncbi:polynucleotide 5'-hydroxyl-kinase NOL9-like isoform X2 [Oscarella lobularis]|uniref:polynucleotide 5'-hydroxyl-kinase NOL9-like isoform X2 n=1 Tax=Oscarella lobularis TaxID=121494 RepID=UPI003313AAE1